MLLTLLFKPDVQTSQHRRFRPKETAVHAAVEAARGGARRERRLRQGVQELHPNLRRLHRWRAVSGHSGLDIGVPGLELDQKRAKGRDLTTKHCNFNKTVAILKCVYSYLQHT